MKLAILLSYLIPIVSAIHITVDDPASIVTGCISWINTDYKWDGCKGLKKANLTACVCKNDIFLETTAYCVDRLVQNATFPDAAKVSYKQFAKTCKANKQVNGTYLESLGNKANDAVIESPKKKANVTAAFRLSDTDYFDAYVAQSNKTVSTPRSLLYVGNILSYWAGVFLLRIIYYWFTRLLPKTSMRCNTLLNQTLRKHISLPATFRYSHSSQPKIFRYATMHIPTRGQTIILFGYFVVNWVLIFAYLPLYNAPNPNYKNSYAWQVAKAIATRTGYAVTFQLPLVILLGGRNNLLLWLTGWPMDTFNVFHRWIGRVIFLDLVAHAITYSKVRAAGGRYVEMWSTPYWNWGVVGIIFCSVLVGFATNFFRRFKYELFLIAHVIFAIMFLVAGFWHLKLLKDELNFFYAAFAVWGFDRLVRATRVIISNPLSRVRVRAVDQNTLEFTIKYSGLWKAFPGAYVFIHIVQPAFFWESHPFSLMDATKVEESGQLKLYARTKDGMTRRAMTRCVENDGEFESYIWIDGPYGENYRFDKYDQMVFIAGGIGITAVYSCIQDIIKRDLPGQVTLHWGIMTESPQEWFGAEIDYMLQSGKVQINLYVGANSASASEKSSCKDDKSVRTGDAEVIKHYRMMNVKRIVVEEMQNAGGNMSVFTCGPGGVNDDARLAVSQNLGITKHYVEFFEESFSW